jgi:hypothetical protein
MHAYRSGIAQKFGGTLMNWPACKVKGEDSLRVKMCNEIDTLLKKYENRPSYTPGVDELVRSVHDCLRYTLVFEPDRYTEAVKELERQLLAPDNGKPFTKSITFKNFWRENDGETCYQGINAQVTLNTVDNIAAEEDRVDKETPDLPDPIPNSNNFVFELQLHTKESFALKEGEGHQLYEALRDPDRRSGEVLGKKYDNKDDYKRALYRASKNMLVGTKRPFKPDPPIAFYESTVAGATWVNELKVNKTFEQEITGLPYPHGYRITKTAAEHEEYLRKLQQNGGGPGA